jgi:predicted ATPase
VALCQRCLCLEDLRRRRRPPTEENIFFEESVNKIYIRNIEYMVGDSLTLTANYIVGEKAFTKVLL